MFRARREQPWYWSTRVELAINFCVWTLMRDGLRVPPFDRHIEGGQSLQRAGLTPDGWQSWFQAVLTQHTAIDTIADEEAWVTEGIVAYDPTNAWAGEATLGERLVSLWQQYEPVTASRWREHAPPDLFSPKENRRLWKALKPFHAHLPTIEVYLVEYPWTVLYVLPPVSLVLSTGNCGPNEPSNATLLLRGAQELVSASSRN